MTLHLTPEAILSHPFIRPYAEHVFALKNGLSRFRARNGPPIALRHDPPHHDDPPEGPDSFLAEHGFECIEGKRTRRPEMMVSASYENDDGGEGEVLGLICIVDAPSARLRAGQQ
jgi:hypothetical protein